MKNRSRLLLALIVVSVFLTGYSLNRRSRAFGLLATHHALQIQELGDANLPDPDWEINWPTGKSSLSRSEIAEFEESRVLRIRYHEEMYIKYNRARSRPWMPVAADTSPPN